MAAGARVVVAHNLYFDLGILQHDYDNVGLDFPFNGKINVCTMKLSTTWCRLPKLNGATGFKYPTLGELHYRLFGKAFDGAHDALADAKACMRCFYALSEKEVISLPDEAFEYEEEEEEQSAEYLESLQRENAYLKRKLQKREQRVFQLNGKVKVLAEKLSNKGKTTSDPVRESSIKRIKEKTQTSRDELRTAQSTSSVTNKAVQLEPSELDQHHQAILDNHKTVLRVQLGLSKTELASLRNKNSIFEQPIANYSSTKLAKQLKSLNITTLEDLLSYSLASLQALFPDRNQSDLLVLLCAAKKNIAAALKVGKKGADSLRHTENIPTKDISDWGYYLARPNGVATKCPYCNTAMSFEASVPIAVKCDYCSRTYIP